MGLRDDWNNPTELDAFRGLFGCQDDNSYYASVKGFAQYVGDVQRNYEQKCVEMFGRIPLRVQNLTQQNADNYNNTGCFGAQAGPQCVQDNLAGKALNPNLSQFQIYCLNDCMDPDIVQSGEWEQAGDTIRQSCRNLWQKFLKQYPPATTAPATTA